MINWKLNSSAREQFKTRMISNKDPSLKELYVTHEHRKHYRMWMKLPSIKIFQPNDGHPFRESIVSIGAEDAGNIWRSISATKSN